VGERPSGGFLGRHGYGHDLFITYSHGDLKQAGTSQLKRWTHQFRDLLQETLDSYGFAPPVRLFLDEGPGAEDSLDRAAPLTPELEAAVARSALLQVMMTPAYLNSRWCARELEHWAKSQPDKPGGGDRRIIVARVLDTGNEPWPKSLCDAEGEQLPGWRFYQPGQDFPYGWAKDWRGNVPDGMESQFFLMAGFIARRLRELDAELEQKSRREALVKELDAGRLERVYLYGREDEREAWAAVYDDLDQLGILVTPGEPEPLDADDDARKREQYARLASKCDAMMLVGNDPVNLDWDLDVIGHERRQFIWSRHGKYLPCAVVDRDGSLGLDTRVRNARRRKIDWLSADCEWPECIRAWLKTAATDVADSYGLAS
jgi:hypothetical protein